MKKKLAGLFILISLCFTGCGYQFEGAGSVLPEDVTRVYIPRVENTTAESSLTTLVTEALRDRFERYGVLYVVEDENDADAILNARITDVKRDTRTSTGDTDTALQFSTSMILDAELRRVVGPVLWRNKRIVTTRTFGAASNVVVTSSADFAAGNINAGDLNNLTDRELSRGQEREVFEEMAEQAARQIYEQAVLPEF